jgi:hypothetical protein
VEKMAILPYRDLQPTRDQVEEWFHDHNGNIGILLKPSRLTILDADSKEAIEEVETLLKGHRTATVETRKGRHYYFQSNPETPNVRLIQKGECRKIDILSDGYIIAPPSERYTWLHTPKDVGVLDVTTKLQQYIKMEAEKQIKTTTFVSPYSKTDKKREIEEFRLGKAMQDIIVHASNSPYWPDTPTA